MREKTRPIRRIWPIRLLAYRSHSWDQMAFILSLSDVRHSGISIRAEEAVAIVQQLIHNAALSGDTRIEPPFGPPSPDRVLIDEHGLVTCRSCESTLGVAEVAIFLQELLPAGSPRVPGGLRYMIARALHDVEVPPFDSIDEFSAGLARFERGDRTEVIRDMIVRLRSTALDRAQPLAPREDRRQRMPTASDFRRELRAADARLYAQQIALRALAPEPQPSLPSRAPQTERRRTATIVAGVMAGLILIAIGEVMHIRSTPASYVGGAAPVQEVTAAPGRDRDPAVREAQSVPTAPRSEKVTTAAAEKPRPAKVSVRRTSSPPARRPQRTPGKMDRLHLGWLRNIVTVRTAPL